MTEFAQHPIEILSRIEAQEYVKGSMKPLVMIEIDAIPNDMSIEKFKEMWYSSQSHLIFRSDDMPPPEIIQIQEVEKLIKPIVK